MTTLADFALTSLSDTTSRVQSTMLAIGFLNRWGESILALRRGGRAELEEDREQ